MQIFFKLYKITIRFLFGKKLDFDKFFKVKFFVLLFLCRHSYFKKYVTGAMALVGENWNLDLPRKDCVVFFNVPLKERKKLADALPHYRCAFAFKSTAWYLQCAFILRYMPKIVFELAPSVGDAYAQRNTRSFIRKSNIPVFSASTELDLELDVKNIHISSLDRYYPVILYGDNWEYESASNDIVLCCCPSYRNMVRYAQLIPGKRWAFFLSSTEELDQLATFLDDFVVHKIVSPGKTAVHKPLADFLAARSLTVEALPNRKAALMLLEPYSNIEAEDAEKPLAILLNGKCPARYARKFSCYSLFYMPPNLPLNVLELLCDYTLVWIGNELPPDVQKFCLDNKVPVIKLVENLLSLYGYRKNFSTPLFEDQDDVISVNNLDKQYVSMADSLDLDDPGLLARAAAFRSRLLALQSFLVDKDDDNSKDRPARPKENFVLAVWGGSAQLEEEQCKAFLEIVAKREKGKKIFCLAMQKGDAVSLYKHLNLHLKSQCFFLKHAKDIDALLSYTDTVYVHASPIGFGALLAGKRVVVSGDPWYAGWGLTVDLAPVLRSRVLTLDQLTTLVFFCGAVYTAPYSGETLTPEEALALWYMRQRPDFSRVFEGLQNDLGNDPRYLIMDLRSNYYDSLKFDDEIAELLQASIFGSVLADLLMFRGESKNFRQLLDKLPHEEAINVFNLLNIQAYFTTNYVLVNFFVQEACTWFACQEMSENNVLKFYNAYFDATIRNRFAESSPPVFFYIEYTNSKIEEKIYYVYSKILLFLFLYDRFSAFFLCSRDFSAQYYLDIIKILYTNSREVLKETNIKKRLLLRYKVFKKYLAVRRNEGKKDLPKEFTRFIICALLEKRHNMDFLSEKLMPLCANKNFLSEDARELLYMVIDLLVSNKESELASTLLERLTPKKMPLPSKYAALRAGRANRAKHATFEQRTTNIVNSCARTRQNINNTDIYHQRIVRSNNYSLLRHYQKTSEIVCKAKPPRETKGVVFFGYYGSFFSATLPIVLHRLVERGYGVYPIFNNHLALPVPKNSPYGKFAYALPTNDGPLRLQWTINFPEKRISALGINLYDRFFESVATLVRRYDFDWKMAHVQRLFHSLLKQTDSALFWCDQLYKTFFLYPDAAKIGILSLFPYQLPEAAFFDYVMSRGNKGFRYIQFKNKAHFDLVHRGDTKPTGISAFDMGLYPDCRLSFLPARSRFEPWYISRKDDPEFQQQLQGIKQDLRARTSYGEGEILDRLRQAKAAGKRIVCCIGRLLFDQSVRKDGGPGHEDMRDWLQHSVEVAADTPDLLLIIRPHPHEENPVASVRARQTLRDVLPKTLPPNVMYSQPGDMNIQALVGLIDLAVLWLGTAAYELAALGTPVAICSYAGYDQTPYNCLFPESRFAYANLLRTKNYPVPDLDAQDRGAASLHYIATSGVIKDYPYAYVRLSNSFRIIPYYHKDLLERYFAEGDPRIEAVVDAIVEGFKT